jgi:hypothetical protein
MAHTYFPPRKKTSVIPWDSSIDLNNFFILLQTNSFPIAREIALQGDWLAPSLFSTLSHRRS